MINLFSKRGHLEMIGIVYLENSIRKVGNTVQTALHCQNVLNVSPPPERDPNPLIYSV